MPRALAALDLPHIMPHPCCLLTVARRPVAPERRSEAVGAAARIDAQFGLELERAAGAVDRAASRLAGKLSVLVGGFGIERAIRPHLLEYPADLLEFINTGLAPLPHSAPGPGCPDAEVALKPLPLLVDRERFERNYQERLLAVGCTRPQTSS